jgi:conjugal transfer mating pair stabilization protein TraG
MATMTIYTASADVTLLNAIFNGVAMMCKQTTLIWGFAMLAAMYRLLSTSTVGALGSVDGSGGRAMARGSMSAVMPFVFAMLLTNSALKSQVVVESTLNGKTTAINNVPWAIGAIPAAASIVSNEVGKVVSTAFQAVGTDYPSLSASANGFMNPMKVLLSARTAASRLSGIDSQVRTLVSACLGPDSGADYAAINAIVVNAGNTGATAAQTLPIHGYASTALGALLYQASLNKSGLVAGLTVAGTSVASCADAANLVAQNIDNAVSSPEFARVVQGAVNGMDQPIATADYSVDHVVAEYTALRTANTVANTLAAGAGQAGAEMM